MNPIIVPLVVAAVVAAVVIALRAKRHPHRNAPSIDQLDAFMAYSAEEAVSVARDMGIALDYSEQSIKRANDALAKIREEYLEAKSEDGVWGLSVMFGAYVGEVLRREIPALSWKKDHETAGPASFPLCFGSTDDAMFPVGWCYKRITNGEEDDIVFKVRVMRERMTKKGEPGATDNPGSAQ